MIAEVFAIINELNGLIFYRLTVSLSEVDGCINHTSTSLSVTLKISVLYLNRTTVFYKTNLNVMDFRLILFCS